MKVYYPTNNRGAQRIFVTPAKDGGAEISDFVDDENRALTFEVVFHFNHGTEVSDPLGKYLIAKKLARKTPLPALVDGMLETANG
jgi:hypothetical protein